MNAGVPMHFEAFSFGTIRIDGVIYEHDVVISHGRIHKRDKKPSKKYRDAFGHTPLSIKEDIPWNCPVKSGHVNLTQNARHVGERT
jgi:hypothetical protein